MDLIGAWRLRTTGNFYTDLYLRASLNWQSTDLNKSSVHTQLSIYQSAYSYTTDSWSAGLTGTTDKSGGRTTFSAGETVLATGDFEVAHNADGTGSATIYCWVSQTWGGSLSNLSANYALPTIPRATAPNCGNGTAGQNLTINTPRASSGFTHNVYYTFGNKSGTIATEVGTSCNWNIPMELETQIPNSSSGVGTITCDTYNSGTKIGSKSCSVRIYASSVPSISGLTCTEANSYVSKKGTNITVQGISRKTISCTVKAQNGASISSVNVNGNANLSKGSNDAWTVTVGNPQNGKYVITAKDSRGRTSSYTVSQTFYSYSKPSVSATLKRAGETSANGTLTVNGTYSNILSNTVSMTIKRNDESSASSVTPSASSGNVSFSKSYTDLSYVSSFSITVNLTDSFGETVSTTAYLGVGQYSMWLGKYDLKVGGNISANGNLTIGGSANVSKTMTASDYKIANASSAVPHLVGSAWYSDKAINNVTVNITGSLASHRFANMSIYDSNYVQKITDSDGFCSVKILKKGMYLIPFKIQGSNVSGANGTIFYGYSINTATGSGQWGWDQYDQRVSLYACAYSTAFVKVLNEGDILKWQVCGDNTRIVEGIEMWLIYLAS